MPNAGECRRQRIWLGDVAGDHLGVRPNSGAGASLVASQYAYFGALAFEQMNDEKSRAASTTDHEYGSALAHDRSSGR
jgi:hypothetical protein